MIPGKLEVTIKINELPQPKTVDNGWQEFQINCDGRVVTATISEKFVDGCKWLELMLLQVEDKPRVETSGIPDVEFNRLKDIGIHLNHATATQL